MTTLNFGSGLTPERRSHLVDRAKHLGITQLERFDSEDWQGHSGRLFDQLLRNRENHHIADGRRLATVFYPQYDYEINKGRAFNSHDIDRLFHPVLGFRTLYYECPDAPSFIKYFDQATSRIPTTLCHIGGHGTPTTLQFGDGPDGHLVFDPTSANSIRFLDPYSNRIIPEGALVLHACSSAASDGPNLACGLSLIFKNVNIYGKNCAGRNDFHFEGTNNFWNNIQARLFGRPISNPLDRLKFDNSPSHFRNGKLINLNVYRYGKDSTVEDLF